MRQKETSEMRLCLLLVGLTLLAGGCASTSKTSASREPASACSLEPVDGAQARTILAQPQLFDRKIQARLNAVVEGYLLGEKLITEFDELVAKGFTPERIFFSRTYARLQALKVVVTDL